MAKTSMVNRDIKRAKLAAKYAVKREELKKIISSPTASYEDKEAAVVKLQKLPRERPVRAQRLRWRLGEESRGSFCSLTTASSFSS